MKEHNDSKVPTIRFKGFEGEWVEKMLGDVCAIGDADHWMPETTSHGIPYVMTGDFCGINEIDFKNAKLISLVDFKKLSKRIKPEFGDILFARYASIGSVRYVNTTREFIASYSCAIVKSNSSFNSEYLFYLIQTDKVQNQLKQSINTGSQGNIGIESLKTLATPFPERTEQDKSAKFFSRINEMLRLHQSKHDKLVTLKKAMLQKMFPQAGATTPEIRFKGFTGDWVSMKLGELATFSKGRGYSKIDLTVAGTPIVLYGSLYVNYQTVISDVGTFVTERKGSIKSIGKEVVVPASGETAEDIARASAILAQGIILGGDLNIVTPFNELDSCFLALTLSNGKPQRELTRRAQGKTVVHVRKADLESILIPYPKLDEQQKIGTYFRKLDELISKHAIQLKKLKQLKSVCLEKMFV
jgi:type I restriction enzyme S subunit